MTRRRSRTPRGGLIELGVVAVAVLLIYLFLMNGGPTMIGRLWASLLGAP